MANRTVLLIDYEPRSIEDTRRRLEEAGYAVEVAHDGVAGLEAFHRVHPDLVLVEAMLPKKHGFDVCQEIKNSADGKDTPVVITTGVYRGRKYRNQALQNFGCDEYLEKPFTDEALLDACNRFIEVDIAGQPGEDPVASLADTSPDGPPSSDDDVAGALDLERMTEDEISNRLDSLLADFGEAVDVAAGSQDDELSESASGGLPVERAAVPDGRESIFDTAAQTADVERPSDGSTEVAPPPEVEDPEHPAGAPVGPASSVFGGAADLDGTSDDPAVETLAGASATEGVDAIPIAPVAVPAPAETAPATAENDAGLRAEADAPTAPTKSTILENRPATTRRRRWLLPVVAVVVLGAAGAAGALWMSDRAPEPAAPVVASRAPVTFAPSVATRAGFADDGPGSTEDRSAVPGDPLEPAAVDPDRSGLESEPAAPPTVATPENEPAVRIPDRSPAVSKPEPTPAATGTVEVAEREPVEVPVATRPEPEPVKPSAPAVVAEVPQPVAAEKSAPDPTPVETRAPEPEPAAESAAIAATALPEIDPVETTPRPVEPAPVRTEPAISSTPAAPEPVPVRAGDLVELTEVDTEPVAVSKVTPRYNAVAKQAKQQGDVILNVLVDEHGAVADVNVLKGIEGSMLDEAAVRAIRKWSYEPATKDGVPVKVWTMEIVSFRL